MHKRYKFKFLYMYSQFCATIMVMFGSIKITLPIIKTIKSYHKSWLRRDVIAGLTVAAVAIPQAMAYAQLAGAPLIAGLYAALVAMLVFSLFSTSRLVIVGPDATMAALVGAIVIPLSAGNPASATGIIAILAILIGLSCLAGVFLRVGFVVEFLSRPILLGYMAGLAMAVIASQLPKLFGLPSAHLNFFGAIFYVFQNLSKANILTIVISVSLIALSIILQKTYKRIPPSLIILVGSILASAVFGLAAHGVSTVGNIPTGLPLPEFPAASLVQIQNLIIPAIAIMLVSYANTIATARSFAAKRSETINSNQEFFGLGVSNIMSGIFGGIPVGGSGSRTAINSENNAKTQVSQLFGGFVIALSLLVLAHLLKFLPECALAVIIIIAVSKLFDYKELKSIWRAWRSEAILAIVTVLGVTLIGVLQGLLLAVFLAMANLVRKSAFPNDAVLGVAKDLTIRDASRPPKTSSVPGLIMYRFDAPLYFANANYFQERVMQLIRESDEPVKWFLWDAETITTIDSTAGLMLLNLIKELHKRNITFAVARLKGPIRSVVHKTHRLNRTLQNCPHYSSMGLALEDYHAQFGTAEVPRK